MPLLPHWGIQPLPQPQVVFGRVARRGLPNTHPPPTQTASSNCPTSPLNKARWSNPSRSRIAPWRQANASYQDRVAIIGGGTIGQLCLAVAKAIGVRETLITTKYPQQADLARDLGADRVVDITATDVKDVVNDLTDGMGYDAVIETVGTAQNFDDSIAIARRHAMIVLVAGYFKPLEVDLRSIVWSEVNITGSNCYGFSGLRTDFDIAIDLIASGRVQATKLVTHRYPFASIAEAFHTAADKKSGSVKVHLVQ